MPKTEWHRIASLHRMQTEILPENGVVTVSIDNKKICLGRFGDKFFAIADKCPHAGASLGSGWCDEAGNVVCPHHRLHFNPQTGQLAAGKGYYVKPYPVEIRDGAVYIGVEKRGWLQ